MRWKEEGAQSILDLSAIYQNEEWEDFHQHREKHQKEILYPYHKKLNELWDIAA